MCCLVLPIISGLLSGVALRVLRSASRRLVCGEVGRVGAAGSRVTTVRSRLSKGETGRRRGHRTLADYGEQLRSGGSVRHGGRDFSQAAICRRPAAG